MISKKSTECGFMMMNVVFLTLIVSFTALIFLNGISPLKESDSALRLVALNLANEQFAEIESLADSGTLSAGSYNFLGASEDLKNYGVHTAADLTKKNPTKFSVTANVKNYSGTLFNVTVKVSWNFNGKNFEIELEKIVRAGG